jgi:hypothetical protein
MHQTQRGEEVVSMSMTTADSAARLGRRRGSAASPRRRGGGGWVIKCSAPIADLSFLGSHAIVTQSVNRAHERAEMLVLSLDIDFFVDPVARDMPVSSQVRLSSTEYNTDDNCVVASFLEEQCLLTPGSMVPGIAIQNHDQAWDILRVHAASDGPVDLVHVDAHSDLGMGDPGYCYLLAEWLHMSPRPAPERGWTRMNLANWLAFAAAAGFIRKVEFVPRHYPPSDLFPYYLDPPPPSTATTLAFRRITRRELCYDVIGNPNSGPFLRSRAVVHSVPWRSTSRSTFQMSAPPDFVIVCQSPQFTPQSADRALQLVRSYITEHDLGLNLQGPVL